MLTTNPAYMRTLPKHANHIPSTWVLSLSMLSLTATTCHLHSACCHKLTREDPKISEIVTKIYLKYSYKFETSVPFKAQPLWLKAAIPAKLPLLETLSEIFNRNTVKGHQQFSLNLGNVSKMPPFQNLLHQKKSQGARSGEWGSWDNTTILFLAKNCWMLKAVWAGALSWCKNQSLLCHFSGWFRRRLLRNLFNTFE